MRVVKIIDLKFGKLTDIIIYAKIDRQVPSINRIDTNFYYLQDETGEIESVCFNWDKNFMLKRIMEITNRSKYFKFSNMDEIILFFGEKQLKLGNKFQISPIQFKENLTRIDNEK